MKARGFRLPAPLAALMAGISLILPGIAVAQCCAPPEPPPPCCAPPPPCCAPPTPPSTPPGIPYHNVNVPGVSVNVGANVLVNTIVNVKASASASGTAYGTGAFQGNGNIFYGGGGGGGYNAPPSQTGVISGLNVEGVRRASASGSRSAFRQVVIQALCIDDRAVPHPASQVTPDRDIRADFQGELYRCLAGSRLQYSIADYSSECFSAGLGSGSLGVAASASGLRPGCFASRSAGCVTATASSMSSSAVGCGIAQTLTCAKGEALFYSPAPAVAGLVGSGGQLSCRPQLPARECNERSLLRRYGAGMKVLSMFYSESYAVSKEESYSAFDMSLDGGVGGTIY